MQISTTVQHQAEMKLGTRLSSFMRQENPFINWYKSAGVLSQMLQSDWLSFSKSMSYYRVSEKTDDVHEPALSKFKHLVGHSLSIFMWNIFRISAPLLTPLVEILKKHSGTYSRSYGFLILTLKLKQTNLLTQVTSLILIATHSKVVKSH